MALLHLKGEAETAAGGRRSSFQCEEADEREVAVRLCEEDRTDLAR